MSDAALYLEAIEALRRANVEFIDAIEAELNRRDEPLSAAQAMVLFYIADQELSGSAVRQRGYYLGTNFSWNLKQLVDGGYLSREPDRSDKRMVRLALTEHGHAVRAVLVALFERQAGAIKNLGDVPMAYLGSGLRSLGRFWDEDRLYSISRMATATQ